MPTYDFSPLTQAQITQTEFAKLLGVSRLTVINWMQGNDPSSFLRRPLRVVLHEIQTAVDRGELPGPLEGMP
nr:hypothetical protein [Anaerolineae bacterium]